MSEGEFERVIEEGRALQSLFPDLGLIAVGGTAAALHCRHRVSLDVDEVTPRLQERYTEVLSVLERWEGWSTNRRNPPVLILGQRHGVELGLRQQRRAGGLETTQVDGLMVATAAEMLRVKAFLLAERRATRDYIDLAALAEQLGEPASLMALDSLNLLYPSGTPQTLITRVAEACESEPVDLASIPLDSYKGLKAPFTDWPFVAEVCQRLGRRMLKRELDGALPKSLNDSASPEVFAVSPNRSTQGFTPLAYLNWIQRGGTEDWKRLYSLCKDAALARTVAAVLVQRDPDLIASAKLWKYLLEDLHPDLHIDLRSERRDTGV